jgi:hypothetical protein
LCIHYLTSLQAPARPLTIATTPLTANVLSGWALNFVTTPSIAQSTFSAKWPRPAKMRESQNLQAIKQGFSEMARIIHGHEQGPLTRVLLCLVFYQLWRRPLLAMWEAKPDWMMTVYRLPDRFYSNQDFTPKLLGPLLASINVKRSNFIVLMILLLTLFNIPWRSKLALHRISFPFILNSQSPT